MTPEAITSDLFAPGMHGFMTRKGGASKGIYAGLNCGPGSADDPQAVAKNRSAAARHLGVASEHLWSLHQCHSADVAVIDDETTWKEARPRADAMVSRAPGQVLGVLTADCAPVLFHDARAAVIGAAHAGWKGAVGGVLEATLNAMEGLGAVRADIVACVGPTISQRSYEVGPEFVDGFLAEDTAYGRFFAAGAEGRAMFDLPSFVLHRLRDAGVGQAEWTGHCTYSDPQRFYSYRRTTHAGEPDYGRQISMIRL